MKLKVAIQMDHVSTIDIDGDSTFVLGLRPSGAATKSGTTRRPS